MRLPAACERTIDSLFSDALEKYTKWYGHAPTKAAYAPGRVEVLGNHTDYNGGYVLSAAIDSGTVFLAAPAVGAELNVSTCRLVAGDLMEERRFTLIDPVPFEDHSWPNYVMGVAAGLASRSILAAPFRGLFFGNVPIGSGLSSSAALEVSAGLALAALAGTAVAPVDMARIGQQAEHEYVGAKTGLLDQISSLYGKADHLVHTDFRTLSVVSVPFEPTYVLLACDTRTSHSLGESDYNVRREACEAASAFFSKNLDHPVDSLRDVSSAEVEQSRGKMDAAVADRAAHVTGENERVRTGVLCLSEGDMRGFGELMFASHTSSRKLFENSCDELDYIVDLARDNSKVLGARLSGGGFGGSVVVLVKPEDADDVIGDLLPRYETRFGNPFVPRIIRVSEGAREIPITGESPE